MLLSKYLPQRSSLIMNFLLISISIISLYFITILISFNPEDPGWLQKTWNGSIHNVGGIIGAQFSDFLFFIFGISAYAIPLFILFSVWKIYFQSIHITIFIFFYKLVGISILLFVFCGLIDLTIGNIFYFSSGGIIGNILCNLMLSYGAAVHHIIIILLLIGMIDIICFFSQFPFIICKMIKEKIFKYKCGIYDFFMKIKKNIYQYIYQKSYDKYRKNPVIFSDKEDNFLQNSKNNFLKKQKFPDLSTDIITFNEKFNSDELNGLLQSARSSLKENFINQTYDNRIFNNQSTIVTLPTDDRVDINYNSAKFASASSFQEKQLSRQTNKYHKKNCDDTKISPDLENKKQYSTTKDTVTFIQDDPHLIQTSSNFNYNCRQQNITMLMAHKDIEQDMYSVFKKRFDTTITDQTLSCNKKRFYFPDENLLILPFSEKIIHIEELKKISQLLESKLSEYRVLANVVNVIPGPVITRFELNLSPGVKSSKISSLSRDLARALSISSVRIIEVIPGSPYVGLEIPNKKRNTVYLSNIIISDKFKKINTPLALVLGEDTAGEPVVEDLRCMPHLLVAGTTGSGKSVGINAMIISILYKATPEEVRFIMIDPKILELSIYSDIPHLLKKVITDTQDVDEILQWCVKEMENRYKLMAMLSVRNLESYNYCIKQINSKKNTINSSIKKNIYSNSNHSINILQKLPYIVVIIDEFSDLMITTTKKIEELIIRLTQKARAAGIYLILATQRPSVDVITGLIKANIPARIAFTVSSKIDSRTILGQSGAESLLGMGDMLYLAPNSSVPIRVHGALIQDKEINAVVNFWKNQSINQ